MVSLLALSLAGQAVALDMPYRWTKQVASDHGGTKVGMALHWPKGIRSYDGLRPQFHHVIDVVPTILEATGLPKPKQVNGVPAFTYNFIGLNTTTIAGTEPLAPGTATIRFEFAYDGGGMGKGGTGALYVNDRMVAEGRIERTQPMIFSADETADVGIDLATPVVEAIGAKKKSRFTGKVNRVTVEID